MHYMGERKLARLPPEHDVYELSVQMGWKPDEIRAMSYKDIYWTKIYLLAPKLAEIELRKRGPRK